jgi:hypothetical protein
MSEKEWGKRKEAVPNSSPKGKERERQEGKLGRSLPEREGRDGARRPEGNRGCRRRRAVAAAAHGEGDMRRARLHSGDHGNPRRKKRKCKRKMERSVGGR